MFLSLERSNRVSCALSLDKAGRVHVSCRVAVCGCKAGCVDVSYHRLTEAK